MGRAACWAALCVRAGGWIWANQASSQKTQQHEIALPLCIWERFGMLKREWALGGLPAAQVWHLVGCHAKDLVTKGDGKGLCLCLLV